MFGDLIRVSPFWDPPGPLFVEFRLCPPVSNSRPFSYQTTLFLVLKRLFLLSYVSSKLYNSCLSLIIFNPLFSFYTFFLRCFFWSFTGTITFSRFFVKFRRCYLNKFRCFILYLYCLLSLFWLVSPLFDILFFLSTIIVFPLPFYPNLDRYR